MKKKVSIKNTQKIIKNVSIFFEAKNLQFQRIKTD